MAKLCFLFVTAFCVVQLALALRLPRETETSTEGALMDALGKLQEGFQSTFTQENFKKLSDSVQQHAGEINSQLKDTFTQENLKKLSDSVSSQAGELNSQLKELAANVQTKFEDLTKSKDEEKKSK